MSDHNGCLALAVIIGWRFILVAGLGVAACVAAARIRPPNAARLVLVICCSLLAIFVAAMFYTGDGR